MSGYIKIGKAVGGVWSWRFVVVTASESWVLRAGTATTEQDARRQAQQVAFEFECGRI